MKKQPEVTERTRQKFVDAFWELVKEKPVSKIAVSELTRRAGYNRSTFYEYFLDTDDLLSYVEAQLLEEIKQTVLQNLSEESTPEQLFSTVFISMNEKIYLLLGQNGDSTFFTKVQAEMFPLVEAYLPIPKDIPHFDYLLSFAHSALFGLMQHWHEQGKNLSEKEISVMMTNLVLHGVAQYLDPTLSEA